MVTATEHDSPKPAFLRNAWNRALLGAGTGG